MSQNFIFQAPLQTTLHLHLIHLSSWMCHRVVIVNKDKKKWNENNTKIKSSDNIMEEMKKNYMKLYGTINKSESQP